MTIQDGDEMVAVKGDKFVPELGHDEVLQIFRTVEVNEEPALKMVTRRENSSGWFGGSDWKWTELITSFTLPRDTHVLNVQTRRQSISKKRLEICKSFNLYKIPGTQDYLSINDGEISADILEKGENRMKRCLCKHVYCCQAEGNEHFIFKVALSDSNEKWFIADWKRDVVLTRRPHLFLHKLREGKAFFYTKKLDYVAYDHGNDKLRLQSNEYVLEEIPLDKESSCEMEECSCLS